jgi:hypothetical protein
MASARARTPGVPRPERDSGRPHRSPPPGAPQREAHEGCVRARARGVCEARPSHSRCARGNAGCCLSREAAPPDSPAGRLFPKTKAACAGRGHVTRWTREPDEARRYVQRRRVLTETAERGGTPRRGAEESAPRATRRFQLPDEQRPLPGQQARGALRLTERRCRAVTGAVARAAGGIAVHCGLGRARW